jgi:hypothetical protein
VNVDAGALEALTAQVADLSERLERYALEACTLRTIEQMFFKAQGYTASDFGVVGDVLKVAFDAGRAAVSENTAPRPAATRPRHLQAVKGGQQ